MRARLGRATLSLAHKGLLANAWVAKSRLMTNDRSDRPPAPFRSDAQAPATTSRAEIDAFLSQVHALGPANERASPQLSENS